MSENKKPENTEQYIISFPLKVQDLLRSLRALILDLAPSATEKLSYGMPAYFLNGSLVYFAAFKNHIGFYPHPSAIKAFQDELLLYKTSKGAIQFSYDKPLPIDLIKKMVVFRIVENQNKSTKKH
jgi:uncharacterized protein YdhG (YjbR/CyaY superfamily)